MDRCRSMVDRAFLHIHVHKEKTIQKETGVYHYRDSLRPLSSLLTLLSRRFLLVDKHARDDDNTLHRQRHSYRQSPNPPILQYQHSFLHVNGCDFQRTDVRPLYQFRLGHTVPDIHCRALLCRHRLYPISHHPPRKAL